MIDETAAQIREMQTHSSSVVAIRATASLRELLEREYATVDEFERALERNASLLRRANPSHASLQTAMREVVDSVTSADHDDLEAAKAITEATIDRVIDRVDAGKSLAAEHGAELLTDGATVLTHDYSTTVLEALEIATDRGDSFEVYVTEARPRFIGRRMARELGALEGVTATLVTDSSHGMVLTECDRVVIGMDCIVDGQLYNRVGTLPIVTTATHLDVPVTVFGAASKIHTEGFVFENEYRVSSEVLPEPTDEFDVANPAYDATPVALLAQVVTDEGRIEY